MTNSLVRGEAAPEPPPDTRTVALDVVVPVYNEETRPRAAACAGCTSTSARTVPYPFRITIADNASTDAHAGRSPHRLAVELPAVRRRCTWTRRAAAGRCSTVWSARTPPSLAYMDVDLSTDLDALLPLVAPLISGHSDLAIGTRLAAASRVVRGPKREFISRCYNLILRGALAAAVLRRAVRVQGDPAPTSPRQLLPLVAGHRLVLRHRAAGAGRAGGLRIHEVPVDWVDDPDSGSTSSPPRPPTCKGVARVGPGAGRRARCRSRTCARSSGRDPLGRPPGRAARAWPASWSGSRVDRRAVARWPTCCSSCCCAPGVGAAARELPRAARHRGGQHRGQPPAHLRRPRPGAARPAHQAAGPGRLRARPARSPAARCWSCTRRARRLHGTRARACSSPPTSPPRCCGSCCFASGSSGTATTGPPR